MFLLEVLLYVHILGAVLDALSPLYLEVHMSAFLKYLGSLMCDVEHVLVLRGYDSRQVKV